MTGYEPDFIVVDRFRREPRPAPKDYSVPLHVDCSIEYELPDCAKPPQGVKIEPLLMIHPSHFRRLESLRRVPFVNNLPRGEGAPAAPRAEGAPVAPRARPARRCCRAAPAPAVPAAAPAQAAHYRLLLDELLAEPAPAPTFRFESYPTGPEPEYAECGGGKAAASRRHRPHPYLPPEPGPLDCDIPRVAHYELFDKRRALQQLPIYM